MIRRSRNCRLHLLLLLALLAPGPRGSSQDLGPIVAGERFNLHSKILNEDRTLWIYAPDTSRLPPNRYPVIYLLDGDTHFMHAAGIVRFLAEVGRMPETIVVGIESTNRLRDFTPPPADTSVPLSGGADNFLRFMHDELIPYIDAHYATAPFRILVGHSIAGTFALHALLTNTGYFQAYLLISPNLWWGNNALIGRLEAFLKKAPPVRAFVYETQTVRESPRQVADDQQVLKLVEAYRVRGLDWEIRIVQDETHASIVHRSIYDGLEYIYAPWEVKADLMAIGMEGLKRHFTELSDRYGYSIDPPEGEVNDLGYAYLFGNRVADAISTFQWNVQHYPASWNVYDSMGEAYAKDGKTKLAIENYEKSVALNPDNNGAKEMLRKLKAK